MNFVNRNVGVPESVAVGRVSDSLPRTRKWAISYHSIEPVAIAIDVFAILAASILSGITYHLLAVGSYGDTLQYVGSAAAISALFIALAKNRDLYKPTKLLSFKAQIRSVAVIWVGIFLFCAGVVFALKIGKEFSRGATLLFAVSGIGALFALRVFWRLFIEHGLTKRKFAGRSVVLISDSASAGEPDLIDLLMRHGLQMERQFLLPEPLHNQRRCQEVIRQVITFVRGSEIEEIIVGADIDCWKELSPALAELRTLPLPVNMIPFGPASKILTLPSHTIGNSISIELQRGPLSSIERMAKRAVDIVCALTGLVLLMPLFLMTAIAIKMDSPGPVLFKQRRCGFNGKQFQILKFRTMTVLEDGDSITQAARDDSRITSVGKWLRRTSIDELPQLFNVLSGSMSIVGPRPHAVAHDNHFYTIVENYALRHHVKPGLTGWAQVNGYRGETPTPADMDARVKLDLWYIDNWNLSIDFLIIGRTAIEILRGNNAY